MYSWLPFSHPWQDKDKFNMNAISLQRSMYHSFQDKWRAEEVDTF